MEDAVKWIGKTSGTEEANRQNLITYLIEEYPARASEFPTLNDGYLNEEVYMTVIIKDHGDDPDQAKQQTPEAYLRDLCFKLQGVDTTTANMNRLQVVQLYCR